MVCLKALSNCFLAAFLLWAHSLPFHSHEVNPSLQRTVRVKIVVDEEFRRRPLQFLETRKWVTAASSFFQKNFGLAFQIQDLKYWSSDNSKATLSGLFRSLYERMERGESDFVLGFTGQIRSESEVNGVASYRHGYALVKRTGNEYLNRVTLIHELGHLFGAVDLEKEASVMNKDEPRRGGRFSHAGHFLPGDEGLRKGDPGMPGGGEDRAARARDTNAPQIGPAAKTETITLRYDPAAEGIPRTSDPGKRR